MDAQAFKAWEDAGSEGTPTQLYTSDTTVEALSEVLERKIIAAS